MKKLPIMLFAALLIMALTLPTATAQDPPTPTPIPPIDVGNGLSLAPKSSTFEVEVTAPRLEGVDNPEVAKFNEHIDAIIAAEIDGLRKNFEGIPQDEYAGLGSYVIVFYNAFAAQYNIFSIRFNIGFYVSGAAHPTSYSTVLNYYWLTGEPLELGDLFLPGVDYLTPISDYAKAELAPRFGDAFFSDGADPIPENYKSWNITEDGLLITFDVYQVAAYAAGPQEVLIPYAALQNLIDVNGPLGPFLNPARG